MPNVNKLMQEIHFQLKWWLSVTISAVYAEKGLTLWKRYFESVYTVLFLLVISRKFLCCCIILVNDTLPTSSFLYKLGFKILPTDFLLMWPLLYCFWLIAVCFYPLVCLCVFLHRVCCVSGFTGPLRVTDRPLTPKKDNRSPTCRCAESPPASRTSLRTASPADGSRSNHSVQRAGPVPPRRQDCCIYWSQLMMTSFPASQRERCQNVPGSTYVPHV